MDLMKGCCVGLRCCICEGRNCRWSKPAGAVVNGKAEGSCSSSDQRYGGGCRRERSGKSENWSALVISRSWMQNLMDEEAVKELNVVHGVARKVQTTEIETSVPFYGRRTGEGLWGRGRGCVPCATGCVGPLFKARCNQNVLPPCQTVWLFASIG